MKLKNKSYCFENRPGINPKISKTVCDLDIRSRVIRIITIFFFLTHTHHTILLLYFYTEKIITHPGDFKFTV